MDTLTLTKANRTKVRVWLAERDLTQRWLADAIGVSESTLSLALSGGREMTNEIRYDIARITGLKLRERKAA